MYPTTEYWGCVTGLKPKGTWAGSYVDIQYGWLWRRKKCTRVSSVQPTHHCTVLQPVTPGICTQGQILSQQNSSSLLYDPPPVSGSQVPKHWQLPGICVLSTAALSLHKWLQTHLLNFCWTSEVCRWHNGHRDIKLNSWLSVVIRTTWSWTHSKAERWQWT